MTEHVEDAVSENQEVAEKKERLDLSVEISDGGPCQKHLKVRVPRGEVDRFFDKEFSELVRTATVPGFRPGKTPRRLIERRFRKEVAGTVKSALLMQSLEQVGEEQKLEPISEPKLDLDSIELPDEGDFVFELDVEVPPSFDLPQYTGLRIRKPVKEWTDDDVQKEVVAVQQRFGERVSKADGAAFGDYVIVDVRFMTGKEVVQEYNNLTIRMDEEVVFRDGRIAGFAKAMAGAVAGDTRETQVSLSDSAGRRDLRGKSITAVFVVQDVQELRPAPLDKKLFDRLAVSDSGELNDLLRLVLERRLRMRQDEQARKDVTEQLLANANWELPPDMLRRMGEGVLRRRVFELRDAGYSEDDIGARINLLRQSSIAATATMLRQQFVLQKIAQAENIEVGDDDLEEAVEAMSDRSGESRRRVRARLDKENGWMQLTAQILERKTIDCIVSRGTIQEVPLEEESIRAASVDASAVPEDAESAAILEESQDAPEAS